MSVVFFLTSLYRVGTMEHAYEVLKELCEESGAPKGIELIQAREGDKVIMFGLPGTMEKIQAGEFPPPVVEKEDTREE